MKSLLTVKLTSWQMILILKLAGTKLTIIGFMWIMKVNVKLVGLKTVVNGTTLMLKAWCKNGGLKMVDLVLLKWFRCSCCQHYNQWLHSKCKRWVGLVWIYFCRRLGKNSISGKNEVNLPTILCVFDFKDFLPRLFFVMLLLVRLVSQSAKNAR